MSFGTALTGLKAAASELDVTGNNVANSQTVGFKASRAEFADIFASSTLGVSQTAVGQGVRLANTRQQFTQGQFDFTGRSLDLAINGEGFFRVSDGGEVQYTRNGAFSLDKDGYIVDANGRQLTGFQADGDGNITGAQGPLQVNIGNVAPQASGEMRLSANLDAAAEVPTNPFDSGDPETYNFSTSTTLYDSQGGDHLTTLYFRKTGPNQWNVQATVDGASGVGSPGNEIDMGTVSFDGQGQLTAPADNTLTSGAVPLSGNVADLDLSLNVEDLTQFGAPFEVKQLRQDGYAAGQFTGLGVEPDGRIIARFTNGQTEALGQVALARFPAPEQLQQVGDTSWVETFQSGTPVVAAPGSSGTGSLEPGALEQSNVDITEELVSMITAQRNYQANSQMISTQNQITQEILNIRS